MGVGGGRGNTTTTEMKVEVYDTEVIVSQHKLRTQNFVTFCT